MRHPISSRFAARSAYSSCGQRHRMMRAVDLDSESRLTTGEIDEVRTGRLLTPEFPAVKASITQMKPELSFGKSGPSA